MKYMNYFNYALVIATGLMYALSTLYYDIIVVAVWLTIILAIFQVVLGFFMYLFRLNNFLLLTYLLGVALFFFLLMHGWAYIWSFPPLLALYFTYILHNETKKSEP